MKVQGGEPKRSGLTRFVAIAVAVAAVGGILFGYDTGVISGAILFITGEFGLSPTLEEVATSSVLVGAILGAIAGGFLADRIGRRRSIVAASTVFLAGTGIVVTAPDLPVFLVGMFLLPGSPRWLVSQHRSDRATGALRKIRGTSDVSGELGTVAAIALVDRAGRRPLLLAGTGGMVVSLAVLGAGFAFGGTVQGGNLLGMITAAGLMAYVASFAIGLGPVFRLLIAEIYPLNVRGRAMNVATIANWAANVLITPTFLTLAGALGRAGVFRLVPETKGLTLEEIEEHFRAGRHPRDLKGAPEPSD